MSVAQLDHPRWRAPTWLHYSGVLLCLLPMGCREKLPEIGSDEADAVSQVAEPTKKKSKRKWLW